ncbi:MAG TPA: hypothetical protein VJU83_04325 [Burkholderiales bacterium]|nr:hypothetical protein [Burkholderiales bacterium]
MIPARPDDAMRDGSNRFSGRFWFKTLKTDLTAFNTPKEMEQ